MNTYILSTPKVDGYFYIKIGKTTNFEKRMRSYKLHNPIITDYICFEGNYEDELLWIYREHRINESEWLRIDYNIIEEQINNFNIIEQFKTTKQIKN